MLAQPPFNYTGSKYRLLPQLMPMFDYSRPTLVDLFTGGGSGWCNLAPYFERVIANDIIRNLIEAQQALLDGDAIISETKALCVAKDDKPGYHRLRDDYNVAPTAAKYFALSLCCNNNMARFNTSFKFNQTFGRRTWNSSTTEKVSRYTAHTRAYRSRVRLARELHRGATQRGLPDGRQENAPGPWRGLRGVPENTGRLRGTDPAALSWRDIESNSAGLDLEHHISERQRCPASSPPGTCEQSMERLCATQTNAKQIPEMKKIRVCFIRMDGALVDALRVVEITTVARTKDEALQRLTRAIDGWVRSTDDGRKAWAESSEDFNVGDLVGYLDQCGKAVPSLQHYLDLECIARIKDLFVLTNSGQESYDRILALAA